MREYSELHDTGDDGPCEKGWCCTHPREVNKATEMLEQFRANPPEEIEEARVLCAMKGQEGVPDVVHEFLFLLDHPWRELRMQDFCVILGISRAMLMKYRAAHSDLEAACRLYLAGLAEDCFEREGGKMPSTVLGMGLERLVPAFAKVPEDTLSSEDITVIVRTIVDGIKAHVTALDLPESKEHAFIQAIASTILSAFALRVNTDGESS